VRLHDTADDMYAAYVLQSSGDGVLYLIFLFRLLFKSVHLLLPLYPLLGQHLAGPL